MKTILLAALFISLAQIGNGQGHFHFINDTDCAVDVRIKAYGPNPPSCPPTCSPDNGWYGPVTCPANTTTQVSNGTSGLGGEWGAVEVTDGGNFAYDGDCIGQSGSVNCNSSDFRVYWQSCDGARLAP